MGVNVGNAIAAAGEFDADAATDNDADFTALLDEGVSYTVQNITTGAAAAVTGFDATRSQQISQLAQATYEVRADVTIGSLGAANEAGLGAGNATTADVVWIPTANGFAQVFYDDGKGFPPRPAGWRAIGAGAADQAGTSVHSQLVSLFSVVKQKTSTLFSLVTFALKLLPSASEADSTS